MSKHTPSCSLIFFGGEGQRQPGCITSPTNCFQQEALRWPWSRSWWRGTPQLLPAASGPLPADSHLFATAIFRAVCRLSLSSMDWRQISAVFSCPPSSRLRNVLRSDQAKSELSADNNKHSTFSSGSPSSSSRKVEHRSNTETDSGPT